MASTEVWRSRMIEFATADLREWSSKKLCVVFAVEFIRVIDAMIWALDDDRLPPMQIHREALELAGKARAEVYARVARCSPSLAESVVVGLYVVQKITDELLRRMTPSAVAWWKTLAPAPEWRPEAAETPDAALSKLFQGLQIDRLMDFTSSDPRDLQGDAVVKVGQEYNEQMRQISPLLPASFDFAPLENSLGVSIELRGERWRFLGGLRDQLAQTLILRLLPLVSGFDPARQARDGYRRTFAEREAKKRGGTGGRHARASGTEDPKAVEVGFDDQAVPAAQEVTENVALRRIEADRLLRKAQKRFGAKGRRFFEELASGARIEEAARSARISRQTGHSYIRKLLDESE